MGSFEIRNVYKTYLNTAGNLAKVVLQDINLDVHENEFLCILGPSGCGKTTLLNMMAGFEFPLKGEVLFNGGRVEGPGRERAVIFQEFSLMPWTSVLKNVAFAIDRREHTEKERLEMAMGHLEMAGLKDVASQRPGALSGGMKQRVAIARSLAMEPEVLLMDEPFSHLDEQTKKLMDSEILRIWRSRETTVVFITHSIDEALSLGTRIVMMSKPPGRIVRAWDLPRDEDRDPASEYYLDLKREVHEALMNDDRTTKER